MRLRRREVVVAKRAPGGIDEAAGSKAPTRLPRPRPHATARGEFQAVAGEQSSGRRGAPSSRRKIPKIWAAGEVQDPSRGLLRRWIRRPTPAPRPPLALHPRWSCSRRGGGGRAAEATGGGGEEEARQLACSMARGAGDLRVPVAAATGDLQVAVEGKPTGSTHSARAVRNRQRSSREPPSRMREKGLDRGICVPR
jgi:hypothetical protein